MERRIPADHPLRRCGRWSTRSCSELSPRFDELYSRVGRPSIAPEKLLRALLLQVLYTIRSERLLMEQLDYNLLFRWFVGLEMDDPIWDATVFTKNRERLLGGEIARAFFERVVAQARERGLLSDEHFTVDGTLIEAWASLKSFKRKDAPPAPPDDPGNPTVNFHGERRSNDDPRARRRIRTPGWRGRATAQEAKLGYMGHVADGEPQRAGRRRLRAPRPPATPSATRRWSCSATLHAGRGRHARRRQGLRHARLRRGGPAAGRHPARGPEHHRTARSAIDGRTTRHPGYAISQRRGSASRRSSAG